MSTFESYWNSFLKKDAKCYDGIAFEDLIEELLTLMYGKKWSRTPETHDGNRDFYLYMDDETFWAECKNYKDTLSLKTLSPTLVMAQVCDANTILFFSRSEINHFAKEKITTYGHKTSKTILFYDDKLLEKLIIKYNNKLSLKYQLSIDLLNSNQTSKCPLSISEFFFPTILSKMITTEDDYIDYRNTSILHYNETFSLLITACNNSVENCNVEIAFAEDNIDRFYYEYLDKSISSDSRLINKLVLKPGQSIAFSLNLRVTRYKRNIYLPNFHVKYIGANNQTAEWMSKAVKVQCKWVGVTKLLGNHYNNIIKKSEDILTNNNELSAMLLTGSSGTGKSRILNECCCPLLKNGYRILELNVTIEHSTSNLIKEIIYFLYEVPAELIMQVISNRIDGKVYEGINVDTDIIMRIARMIKTLDGNLNVFMKQYKELLFEKLSKRKIAIIVDNMQFASDSFQQFWRCYVDYSVNQCRTNKTILITSVNLDYMTKESAKTIYTLQNSNIKHLVNEFVDGFKDVNQGVLFLRELIHIENESCDSLFREIIESVSLNPFNLYQMIKLLEEDEIIKHLPDKQGYLLPTEATWQTIWKVPRNIDDTLRRRFDFINIHMNKESFSVILSACYLFEIVDEPIIKQFNINLADLIYLVEHQILMHTDRGYSFVHDIIRKYYEQNWAEERLLCLTKIETVSSIQAYGGIYKLYRICFLEDEKCIIKLCKNRNLSSVPVRLQSIFLEKLFEQCIKCTTLMQDVQSWLDALSWICDCTRNVMGSIKALDYYNKTFDYIENTFDDFSIICCKELRNIFHSHCDIYIQMHQRDNAVNFAYKIISRLSREPIHNQSLINNAYEEIRDEYYVLKAIMFNRIFCAYNNAFPTDEIILKRNDAIRNSRSLIPFINNEYKRNLIAYLNNSDEGYRYYGFKSEYIKLMHIWEECLIDIPHIAPEKTMNYYRKQVQCHLIKQDDVGVRKYISEGRTYLNCGEYSHEPLIFNTFFTMAEIINNLQHNPNEMYLYTESLLNKLVKMQLLLKNNKMGDIYLLKGINSFYANDSQTVYHALKKAYQTYNAEETSYYWIKRELMKETIIAAYAILEITESHYDISFLSKECREKILQFSKINYCAKGIIQTKDRLFNLPLVV